MSYGTRRARAGLPWIVVAVVSVAATLLAMLPAAWIVPQFGGPRRVTSISSIRPARSGTAPPR